MSEFKVNRGAGTAVPVFDFEIAPAFLDGPEAAAARAEWLAINEAGPALVAARNAAAREWADAHGGNASGYATTEYGSPAAWLHAYDNALRDHHKAESDNEAKAEAALRKYRKLQRTESAGRANADEVLLAADETAKRAWAELREALQRRSQAARYSRTYRADGYAMRNESSVPEVLARMDVIVSSGVIRRDSFGAVNFAEVTL